MLEEDGVNYETIHTIQRRVTPSDHINPAFMSDNSDCASNVTVEDTDILENEIYST